MKCFKLSFVFLVVVPFSTALFVPESNGLLARQVSLPKLLTPTFRSLILLATQNNKSGGNRGNNTQTGGNNNNNGGNNNGGNNNSTGGNGGNGDPATSLSESLPPYLRTSYELTHCSSLGPQCHSEH